MVDTAITEYQDGAVAGSDLSGLFSRYRRYIPLVAITTVVCLALSIIVTFLITPLYTADTVVLYAPQKQAVLTTGADNTTQIDEANVKDQTVDTQTEVIQAPDLALEVERRLNLDKDPEFIKLAKSEFKAHPGVSPAQRAQDFRDAVATGMLKRLKAKRVGQTLLISIDFTSEVPFKAARIANTWAQAYLDQQLAVKLQQGQAVSALINSRLESLRRQVLDAESAVERYRIANNLLNVSTSVDPTAATTTITQQEVAALNDQLAIAKADAAGAQARLESAQKQLRSGQGGETVGEALDSPVVAELRRQYAEVSRRVAQLETSYGPKYADLIAAKSERADLEHQIQDQVDRIMSNLQAEANVANQRLASIDGSLSAARGELAAGNVASVQLMDLQRSADASKTLYEAFLASAKSVEGQNVVARPDSEISAVAAVPLKPSFPILLLDAAIGLVFGAGLGIGLAYLHDQWSANFSTLEDVERRLGLPYAGAAPTVKSSIDKPTTSEPIDAVVAHPLSSFAEAFRNLAATVLYSATGNPMKVLIVSSALPKEGKTATSICLARVMALSGTKVVLIDCDLRRRSATDALAPDAKAGLIEVLDGKARLEDALRHDTATGAWFLPLASRAHLATSPFESAAMDALMARLRKDYDVVVLDTAPVLAVVDTRQLVDKADAILLLVRWRATPARAVRAALHLLSSVGGSVAGVALTMVDLKAQTQSGYGDPSAYYQEIKNYYTS